MTNRKYSEEEAKLIASYLDTYANLQSRGESMLLGKAFFECGFNLDAGAALVMKGKLRNIATTLRMQIQNFRENVPQEIIEKLSVGESLGKLESLATNILVQD